MKLLAGMAGRACMVSDWRLITSLACLLDVSSSHVLGNFKPKTIHNLEPSDWLELELAEFAVPKQRVG